MEPIEIGALIVVGGLVCVLFSGILFGCFCTKDPILNEYNIISSPLNQVK